MGTTLKISKDDIYGAIKGFPLEVVHKMVELTMKDDNIDSEEALKILRSCPSRGFTWSETDEGYQFWNRVINCHEWWRFYNRFPVNLSSPIRYAVVKECCDGCFPDEIVGYLREDTPLAGKGDVGDIYFVFPEIRGFSAGFAIKDSPRYKRIIKDGIEL